MSPCGSTVGSTCCRCCWQAAALLSRVPYLCTLAQAANGQPTCASGDVLAPSELPLTVGEAASGNASSGVVGLPDRRRPALAFLLPLHKMVRHQHHAYVSSSGT
jgi:hypothetical protein